MFCLNFRKNVPRVEDLNWSLHLLSLSFLNTFPIDILGKFEIFGSIMYSRFVMCCFSVLIASNPCVELSFSQNCYTIRTKKLICMWVYVFSNFNTVLLQCYAQFYSKSIQIYHCKNYIISLYFYHNIKFQPKEIVQRLKNNLHIE